MKLGKLQHGDPRKGKSGKIAMSQEYKVSDDIQVQNNQENTFWPNESSVTYVKTNTSGNKASPEEVRYEDKVIPSDDQLLQTHLVLSQAYDSKMRRESKSSKQDQGCVTKLNETECSNDDKNVELGKKALPQTLVDKPWDEFDMKVTKKNSMVDDIFADMAPTLSKARKAPVKGTSMYSETLAVVTDTTTSQVSLFDLFKWKVLIILPFSTMALRATNHIK